MKFLAVLVIYSLSTVVFAQVSQQWFKTYNGPGNSIDEARSIAVDDLGNILVTGISQGSSTGNDYATIKYNSSGMRLWTARYNGPGNSTDYANSIVIDNSGNVYVTGSSQGISTGDDYATIKYNSSGVQQWAARYNGPGNNIDQVTSIAIDNSGNVYVTGNSAINITSFNYDYATIKYNSSGVQQWVVRYNGPGNFTDYANSIAIDNSGNVYVTGYSQGSGTGNDYATIKYNSSGTQQWVRRYNGPGNNADHASTVAVDNSGNIFVTGYSLGSGTDYDYATIKYNSSGTQQWAARYNGPGNNRDWASSIAADNSGNIFVTGYSLGSGTGYDYATIKYNSSGAQQWASRYNGPGNSEDGATSIAVYNSGNIYVTGYSSGSGTGYDYATIKYNSSGIQQWVTRYNGSGNGTDRANGLAIDDDGNLYVTGGSAGTGTSNDFATIKYHDNALPVEIAYFNSAVTSNNILFRWGTSWELNNSGFEVERRIQNGNWQKIGFVQGYGTTNEEKHYYFEDKKLAKGNYQYRLKQIDYNGNYEYHSLNNDVTIGMPDVLNLSQNYPNPSNPKSKIDFHLPFDGNVTMKVYDIIGREVITLIDKFMPADFYSIDFDGSNLSSGVYFYRIAVRQTGSSAGEFNAVKKMMLVK